MIYKHAGSLILMPDDTIILDKRLEYFSNLVRLILEDQKTSECTIISRALLPDDNFNSEVLKDISFYLIQEFPLLDFEVELLRDNLRVQAIRYPNTSKFKS